MAVRYKGQIMTEVKYDEVKRAEKAEKLTLMQKLNMYFFDEPEISLSDWLWFYGANIFVTLITIITLLIVKAGS